MRGTSRLVSAALFVTAQSLAVASHAETNMLFILDGSNSMWGQIEGQAKITAAQGVLSNLLTDLPAGTKVGLMVYGHRDKTSCDDIELVSAIGADTPDALAGKLKNLQPKGKTPIAGALNAAIKVFDRLEGQNNHVVLISDGIETCEGDPCTAAGALAQANIKARVHVVGFDVGAKERAQLECIPAAGNGKYFSAANANELKVAVAEIKQVAQAAKASERKPTVTEVFRDDFDGEELAQHWEVINPDPDAFIVEDGQLLIVSGTPGSMPDETVENLFKLSESLPKGDWMVTAKFSVEFQTGTERAYIGIFDNGDNYLEISAKAFAWQHGSGSWWPAIDVVGIKRSKGKDKVTNRRVWDGPELGNFGDAARGVPQPIHLRLEKKGRSYIGSLMFESAEEPKWVTLDKFTILRQKGKVAVGLYQAGDVKGESTAMVDWVKIEVPGK